jgi:hypothetical protein
VHGEHGHDHGDEGPDGDDQYRTVHLH